MSRYNKLDEDHKHNFQCIPRYGAQLVKKSTPASTFKLRRVEFKLPELVSSSSRLVTNPCVTIPPDNNRIRVGLTKRLENPLSISQLASGHGLHNPVTAPPCPGPLSMNQQDILPVPVQESVSFDEQQQGKFGHVHPEPHDCSTGFILKNSAFYAKKGSF